MLLTRARWLANLRRLNGAVGANYVYLLLGNLGRLILTFAFTAVVARYLSVEQFGAFSYALAFAELFYAIADLGLPSILTRELARSGGRFANTYYVAAFVLQWGLGMLTFLVIILVTLALQPSLQGLALNGIIGLSVIFGIALKLSQAVFRAFERMEFSALSNLVERLIVLFLVLVVIVAQGSVIDIAMAYTFGTLITAALGWVVVQTRFVRFDARAFSISTVRQLFWMALPLAAGMIFSILKDRAGFILLKHFQGDYAVGIFSAGYRLVIPLFTLASLLGILLVPVFSRQLALSHETFAKSYGVWLKISLAAGNLLQIIVFGSAVWITPLVFGDKYVTSIPVIQVLSLSLVFPYGHFVSTSALLASAKMRALFVSTAWSGITAVVLAYFLIPLLGALGAAISVILAEAVLFVLTTWMVGRAFQYPFAWGTGVRYMVVFLLPYAVIALTWGAGPLVSTIASTMVFLIAGFATGLLGWADVRLILAELKQKSAMLPVVAEECT